MGKVHRTLFAFALALGTAAVFATEPQSALDPTATATPKQSFEQLDTNHDGKIAKSEVPSNHDLSTLFANFDRDQDQALSRTEFDLYLREEEEEAE